MDVNKVLIEILHEVDILKNSGKTPRVILVGNVLFNYIKKDWVKSIKELPWGDTIEYEAEKIGKNNVFLADGSLFGLWVIKVNTIEGFEVR
jgi:hypothetical protein